MKKVRRWIAYKKPFGRKYPLISGILLSGGQSSLFLLSLITIFTAFAFRGTSQEFFRLENINEIRIDIDVSHWETKLHSMKQIRSDDRLPATLFLNGERFDNIGIRYKGNSSYYYTVKKDLSKRPFNIKSDEFRDDLRFDKYAEKIKMSNGFRDPSFVREVLAYEIARKYMPASMANFSKLYINDTYYGLYTSVESIEGRFLKKHFGENDGPFFKCDPVHVKHTPKTCFSNSEPAFGVGLSSLDYRGVDSLCYFPNYERKSDKGWKALLQLIYILNKEPEKLETILNVDRALWMHAFNNVFVNLDSYTGLLCHNYYLYQDEFGIFQPLVWDMNLCFGGFRYHGEKGTKALSNTEMANMSPYVHFGNNERPLISQLLRNKLYRRIYIAHVKTILEEYVFNDRYLERARIIHDRIEPLVFEDENKLYSDSAFKANLETSVLAGGEQVVGIQELMEGRKAYYTDHPLIKRADPKFHKVRHFVYEDSISFEVEVEEADEVLLCYRLQKGAPFRRVPMKNIETAGIADKSIKAFTHAIGFYDEVDYYVIALNDKSASLKPARAAYEFFKIRLE